MVSTVATVNPPVGMFLSCFKEDEMIRLGSACWYLEKNLMGMDGEEEEEEIFFFWIHHQLAVLSVRAG